MQSSCTKLGRSFLLELLLSLQFHVNDSDKMNNYA